MGMVTRGDTLAMPGSWMGVETGFLAKTVSKLMRSLSYFKPSCNKAKPT